MIIKEQKPPAGTTGSYTPIKNLSFVAREFFPNQDDEILESRDGLANEFGGDNYCISSNALYLGLTRGDDGCEPLEEETEAEAMDRYLVDIENDCSNDAEDYEHYRSLEDADVRVAKAVKHALRLQKFFRLRKEQEERKAATRETDEALAEARKAMAEAREFYPEDYDEPTAPEPEVVEKLRVNHRCGTKPVQDTYRPQVRRKNGRSLGNKGSSGKYENDRASLIPVKAIIRGPDGNARCIRIS